MSSALFVARILLALVFTISGTAKLSDLQGSQQAVEDFGVPRSLARMVGMVLPFAELAVAWLLLVPAAARLSSLAGLVMLLGFSVGITLTLMRGAHPNCHCFGQLHSEPVGWSTLARNTALMVLAALVVVWGPGQLPLPSRRMEFPVAVQAAVAAVVMVVLALAVQLLSEWTQARQEPATSQDPLASPPPVGSRAPAFSLPDLDGNPVSLSELCNDQRATFLIFSDPNCSACEVLLPDIERWCADFQDVLAVVMITRGDSEDNRQRTAGFASMRVLLQHDFEVADAYGVTGTPSAIVIHPGGVVGSPLAAGPDMIRRLLRQLLDLLSVPAVEEIDPELVHKSVSRDPAPETNRPA